MRKIKEISIEELLGLTGLYLNTRDPQGKYQPAVFTMTHTKHDKDRYGIRVGENTPHWLFLNKDFLVTRVIGEFALEFVKKYRITGIPERLALQAVGPVY